MTDLFGQDTPDAPLKRPKKDMAHAMEPGTGPSAETCGTCSHHRRIGYHDKVYFKCELVKWSHGHGTDIRLKDKACGKWR